MSSAPQSDWLSLRLVPGDDLRVALQAAVVSRRCHGAHVVSGIGSLHGAQLRLAGAATVTAYAGDHELLTLTGTVAENGVHLHAVVADAAGHVVGGHVAPGCIVRTTAEVLLVLRHDVLLRRAPDAATGYDELDVSPAPPGLA